jgi:MFS family permease
LGGKPEKNVDIPATVVFLVLFIGAAASHMTIFQLNRRHGHKFLFSVLIFGFCMARVVTCIMRIVSTALPTDVSLAIAAQIFTAAGVVIIFIVNLVFAQRLIRSSHPRLGWHSLFSTAFKFLYALVIITIVMIIVVVVQSFYTRSRYTHKIDRDIMLYGVTTFAVISFLPIPLTLATTLIPRRNDRPLDKFGEGRWRYKAVILLIGTTVISFGACYRAGMTWLNAVPQTQPLPRVLGKGPFYIVNFTVEIFTVYLYAVSRVDKRFHVPDGAKEYRSYQKAAVSRQEGGSTADPVEEQHEMPESRGSTEKTERSFHSGDSWKALRSEAAGSNVDVEKQAA